MKKKYRSGAQFNWQQGGTSRGKTQAAQDWANGMEEMLKNEYEKAYAWAKTGQASEPANGGFYNPEHGSMVHIGGSLYAPVGWNNCITTGNFKGCFPIIKPGAQINSGAFESINFTMV